MATEMNPHFAVPEAQTRDYNSCTVCKPQDSPRANVFGSREDYLEFGVPLYKASISGDWEAATVILNERPEFVRFAIDSNYNTALHVAAFSDETNLTVHFVKNLVNIMTGVDLELRNAIYNTALFIASGNGNMRMVKIMVEKNRRLLDIRSTHGQWALTQSALEGRRSVVKYLYDNSKMTGDHWTDNDRNAVLVRCMQSELFDVALQIVTKHPKLVQNVHLLGLLARKPDALNRIENNLFMKIIDPLSRFIRMKVQSAAEEDTHALHLLKLIWTWASRTMNINEIQPILFVAAETGNTRLIVVLIHDFPELVFKKYADGHTIFHVAVMRRHQHIYNLLYEIGARKNDVARNIDDMGNNMLHLVGKSSREMAAKTSGASLLMQRELLWFKEVETMVPRDMREKKNKAGQTPYELFSKENEHLVSSGLKWMKDCMVVAAIIVTVAFAVAFTVPGGYDQVTGIPIFIHGISFLVFVIADAISLFTSTMSLLVFLSVLTSRHDQRDFMYSLPKKLMIGLVSLFISVAAMMVTFGASFFVIYHNGLNWIPILLVTFAAIPVIVFGVLQFPLLVDMFRSTYDSHYLFKPKKRMLYNKTRRYVH